MAANIDPRYKGYQMWSAPSDGLYTCKGVKISDKKPRSCNFAIWWDGEPAARDSQQQSHHQMGLGEWHGNPRC